MVSSLDNRNGLIENSLQRINSNEGICTVLSGVLSAMAGGCDVIEAVILNSWDILIQKIQHVYNGKNYNDIKNASTLHNMLIVSPVKTHIMHFS